MSDNEPDQRTRSGDRSDADIDLELDTKFGDGEMDRSELERSLEEATAAMTTAGATVSDDADLDSEAAEAAETRSVTDGGDGEDGGSGGGAKRRLTGMLATILGLLGCLLSIGLLIVSVRTLFGASSVAGELMDPVEVSVDRMDDRIDQTDDLVDRDGVGGDEVEVLRARVDGLVDVVAAANRAYSTVTDSPVYNLLPGNDLETVLDSFEASARRIDENLGEPDDRGGLGAEPSAAIANELDSMQDSINGARDAVEDARDSFTSWLRLGSLVGVFGSLWSLWAQYSLLRRGFRGVRGRPA